jgi:signal transduction protein with GAF and PtsI domain
MVKIVLSLFRVSYRHFYKYRHSREGGNDGYFEFMGVPILLFANLLGWALVQNTIFNPLIIKNKITVS